jgi:hypothetical protein
MTDPIRARRWHERQCHGRIAACLGVGALLEAGTSGRRGALLPRIRQHGPRAGDADRARTGAGGALRFRGRETEVDVESDLANPPFPATPCRTRPRDIEVLALPKQVKPISGEAARLEREQELAKRRGHPRSSEVGLRLRGVDDELLLEIPEDDFVAARWEDEWTLLIETHAGTVQVGVTADQQLPQPPYKHELFVDGKNGRYEDFPTPLMRDDEIEIDGTTRRVFGVDRNQDPPLATIAPLG